MASVECEERDRPRFLIGGKYDEHDVGFSQSCYSQGITGADEMESGHA
jgi:hypothetical protein